MAGKAVIETTLAFVAEAFALSTTEVTGVVAKVARSAEATVTTSRLATETTTRSAAKAAFTRAGKFTAVTGTVHCCRYGHGHRNRRKDAIQVRAAEAPDREWSQALIG